jgi:hypothetical protein
MQSPSKVALGFTIALSLSGAMWAIDATVSSPAAYAYVARVNLALDRLPNESFNSLARRAELAARAAVQRSFDKDILASDASVIVTGRVSGSEAPILSITVSRSQWRTQPDPHRWATYYGTAQTLLDFSTTSTTSVTPASPVSPNRPVSPPEPQDSPAGDPTSDTPAIPVPAPPVLKAAPVAPAAKSPSNAAPVRSQTPLPPLQFPK